MDQEIRQQLEKQSKLLEKVYQSTEKTRKYFLWTIILSAVLFVVPLIILLFVLPSFINTITSGNGVIF